MSKNVLTLLVGLALLVRPAHAQFPDIPPGHYAESAVTRLVDLGVITGYPDGLFRGQAEIDRYGLSIILTRMWDAWSTAQLNEVWSELSGLELSLARMRQEQSLMRTDLEQIGVLGDRLTRTEEATALLDTCTRNVGETSQAVGSLNIELGRVQDEIASLRTQLGDETRARGAARISVENRLSSLSIRLNRVQRRLEDHQERMVRSANTQTTRYDRLTQQLDNQAAALDTYVASQQSEPDWSGTLSAAGGVNGETADYRIGASLVTPTARGSFELAPPGADVSAIAAVAPGVDLLGRYHVGLTNDQGTFGVRFSLAGGLGAGFYGGFDNGLAAGAFIELQGDEEGAALPGVIVRLGALTNTGAEAGLGSELLVQGVAGVEFGSDAFSVTPKAFYRRQSGVGDHQIIGGELKLELAQEAFSLAAAGRYGFATDLLTSATVGAPEADVKLILASGAFVETELSGGLPDLEDRASFADGSPLQAEQLILGVRVGVSIPLEELLR